MAQAGNSAEHRTSIQFGYHRHSDQDCTAANPAEHPVVVVGAILGWAINLTIFAPLRHKGSELLPLIATIGVSTMMQNAMLAWFGPIPYAFETPYSQQVFRVAGTFFTAQSVIIILVSTATIALLYAFMKFTFLGKALRAVAQDRETAGLMGINPSYLIMLTIVSMIR